MDLMKIATFNINGIKARIQALTDWLNEAQPDVAHPGAPLRAAPAVAKEVSLYPATKK